MDSAKANKGKASLKRKTASQDNKVLDVKELEQVLYGVLMQFANSQPAQHMEDATPMRSSRASAASLKKRVHSHKRIYNAAWFVRFAEHGAKEYREQMMKKFWETFMQEFQHCEDIESLTYAVADSLTLYRGGFPWND